MVQIGILGIPHDDNSSEGRLRGAPLVRRELHSDAYSMWSEDGLESTRSNTSTVGSCNLYAGTSRLSLDGDVATFEDRQWSSLDVPESDCTLEAADALSGTPDCQDVVVRVGTRL